MLMSSTKSSLIAQLEGFLLFWNISENLSTFFICFWRPEYCSLVTLLLSLSTICTLNFCLHLTNDFLKVILELFRSMFSPEEDTNLGS